MILGKCSAHRSSSNRPLSLLVADFVSSKYSWPNGMVSANPCVEIAQYEDFVCVFGFLYEGSHFTKIIPWLCSLPVVLGRRR